MPRNFEKQFNGHGPTRRRFAPWDAWRASSTNRSTAPLRTTAGFSQSTDRFSIARELLISSIPTVRRHCMSVAVVTGSAGLVGSEAVTYFAALGMQVVGIDNGMRKAFFGESASTQRVRDRL